MTRVERRYERVVSAAAAAAFAAPLLFKLITSGPLESPGQYVNLTVIWAVLATPFVIAARLLWRAWWRRTGVRLSTMDGPARMLAVAISALPDERRDWGTAMAAELDQVGVRSARWRFAAGCTRAALFPPRASRVPVLAVAALAAGTVMAAGLAAGNALPGIQVFTVTFLALLGAMVTLAVARSHPVRRLAHRGAVGPAIAVTGLAGAVGCLTFAGYALAQYPSTARAVGGIHSVTLAVMLAGTLWLTVYPPRLLRAGRIAGWSGLGAALAIGAGLLLTSHFPGDRDNGVMVFLMFGTVVIFFVTSAVAAGAGRSFGVGVRTATWTAVLATSLVLAIWTAEALRWYRIDTRLLLDGEPGASFGTNLRDAVFWTLLFVTTWGLPLGVIGAAAGNALRRRLGARTGRAVTEQP